MNIEPAKRLSNNVWWIPTVIGAIILSISTYHLMNPPKPPPPPPEPHYFTVYDSWMEEKVPQAKSLLVMPLDGEVLVSFTTGNTNDRIFTLDTNGVYWEGEGKGRHEVDPLPHGSIIYFKAKEPGKQVHMRIIVTE